ncbi:hypothetical protein PAXRUDRAFT_374225 [Paxillus rubicundulus Ve08.2h10]|uniref:Membrane anchor Opy2 N-terminal domain-containing protein n=1 Tax=Paxillus rubicundulus Ve08.2h10 TaxID=930991 RepID=A0A0D0DDY6_9AGAM|nr:hypothetical protein PAXRUDRAFT_374225 [Paxillus rubicundulus Ve08.2h10]
MYLDLLPRQCVTCPSQPPVCTCSADQSCIQISQSCNACPTFTCRANSSNTSNSGSDGISSGALAGAVVGVLLVFIGALLVFFLYRRRQRARQSCNAVIDTKPDVPAPAEAVLNRPDPTEKPQPSPTTPTNTVKVCSSSLDSVIDVDPQPRGPPAATTHPTSGRPSPGNPFDDAQSIQTTSTDTTGANVIPIALVAPNSAEGCASSLQSDFLSPSSPVRPARPTDLILENPRISVDTLGEPSPRYAHSQRSGLSRVSYMSNASYSSDFLNEAPMIVMQSQGVIRQVVGKVKAEVIQTPGTSTPTSHLSADDLKPPSIISRPSVRSPLAASSFGPADVVDEADEEHELSTRSDPFGDHHVPSSVISNGSQAESQLDGPILPWAKHHTSSRPESVSTQAGSVIDISSATRVNIGLARSNQKSSYRTTMAKLISPASTLSPNASGTLQEQQQLALEHAQAQARAQGLDKSKRMSGTSVVSTTSTRADSILESFPFVPPSPISSRPVRSPPRSPLGQQFTATASAEPEAALSPLAPPPSRRILGMSTASQLSTASSGLGNFPFQIDHGGAESTQPPSVFQGRQRASLDTLALMSDLSSYPLGYDRDDHGSLPSLPKS